MESLCLDRPFSVLTRHHRFYDPYRIISSVFFTLVIPYIYATVFTIVKLPNLSVLKPPGGTFDSWHKAQACDALPWLI